MLSYSFFFFSSLSNAFNATHSYCWHSHYTFVCHNSNFLLSIVSQHNNKKNFIPIFVLSISLHHKLICLFLLAFSALHQFCLFRLLINLIEFVFKMPIIMLKNLEPSTDRTTLITFLYKPSMESACVEKKKTPVKCNGKKKCGMFTNNLKRIWFLDYILKSDLDRVSSIFFSFFFFLAKIHYSTYFRFVCISVEIVEFHTSNAHINTVCSFVGSQRASLLLTYFPWTLTERKKKCNILIWKQNQQITRTKCLESNRNSHKCKTNNKKNEYFRWKQAQTCYALFSLCWNLQMDLNPCGVKKIYWSDRSWMWSMALITVRITPIASDYWQTTTTTFLLQHIFLCVNLFVWIVVSTAIALTIPNYCKIITLPDFRMHFTLILHLN